MTHHAQSIHRKYFSGNPAPLRTWDTHTHCLSPFAPLGRCRDHFFVRERKTHNLFQNKRKGTICTWLETGQI